MIPIIPATQERRRARPRGRQADPAVRMQIQALLGDAPRRRDLLIEHLHRLQDHFGHLSAAHLAALADELRMAQAEVYEVASFYHHFDVVREGESVPAALTVRVCNGLSCQMAGAQALLERLPTLLGADVRVLAAPCIGRCAQAPAALLGGAALTHITAEQVQQAVQQPYQETSPAHIGLAQYLAQGGYRTLQACRNNAPGKAELFDLLDHAGLRGLGGAGFPVGRKWRIVAQEAAPRLMAVNIDEGEPGTFKDRHYLERDPHRFLEGMLIAAWAVDIQTVYIYLRDEYQACRRLLEQEIQALQAQPPVPDMPAIHLRRGAGAYICGEESAMIESLEGKRGLPRLRPPFVAQRGLFGRPTLEHNFESLYWVRELIEKGADWWSSQGRNGRHGLRSFSVSGRINNPGVHLAPAGISLAELLDEYCGGMQDGHELYAYLPGGASGGILPASLAGIPLDFDTLQEYGCFIGSAAIIVLSQHDSAVAAARNMLAFFKDESCGQCTPCRVGTAKAFDLISQPHWDIPLLQELLAVMRDASICGLGQAAPNPVESVIRYFSHELAGVAT